MRNSTLTIFLNRVLLLFTLFATFSSYAQNATIKGLIMDGEENEPLIGEI